jgi:hypothetical protein
MTDHTHHHSHPRPQPCTHQPTNDIDDHQAMVTFGQVTVYEFPMELGHNPACSAGAPVQAKWIPRQRYNYNDGAETTTTTAAAAAAAATAIASLEMELDLYEYLRRSQRKSKRKDLILSVTERASILLQAGHSIDEIVHATLQVEELQKQRRETLQKNGWERFSQLLLGGGGGGGGEHHNTTTTGRRLPKGILSTGGMQLLLNGVKGAMTLGSSPSSSNSSNNSTSGGTRISTAAGRHKNDGKPQPRTVPARSA